MTLVGTKENPKIQLDQGPQLNSVRPAVDPMFASASAIYKDKCLGIVLTGMGADGALGSEKIKENRGAVVIQSEASCVVFGMPGAVKNKGAYDKVLDPGEIVNLLHQKVAPNIGSKLKVSGER